jgi:hypothetical protein
MKLVIIHEYLDNDIQLINSFNSDCVIRHAKDYNHIYSLLNSINDINLITHLVFVYHYPGYCQLPFFDDPHNVQSNYTYFSNNIIELINTLKLKGLGVVDLLSCNLNLDSFINEVNTLQNTLNVNFRYSLNQTGNDPEGDWILESDGVDVRNIYFNNNINQWHGVLNSDIGAAVRSGSYNSIITYNSGTKVFKVVQNFSWNAATVGTSTNFIELNIGETFDGDAFKITASSGTPGFFAINTAGANTSNRPIIKNIGVIGGTISNNGGFIIRRYQDFFIVENCYATGTVPDNTAGGSICASNAGSSSIIRNCFFTGTIGYDSGGIAGNSVYCTIQNCYTTGNFTSTPGYAGAIVGTYSYSCVVQNCYSYNSSSVAGMLGNGSGFYASAVVQNCFSRGTGVGNTSGQNYYIVPGGSHITVNGNYQLLTSTFGTVPTNLNASSTYSSITNTGNGYIADTTAPTGFPLLSVFTQLPFDGTTYLHNTSIPDRFNTTKSDAPVIYRRPLTLTNSVELYWYPPVNDGGAPITNYIIESANIPFTSILPSTDRKSIVRNLVTGTNYVFTIKAVNSGGNGNVVAYNNVIPGFPPNVPTNLSTSTDLSNIYFSFNNPANVGLSALTYNTVTLEPIDMYGNIISNYNFTYYQSSQGSNIIDPINLKRINGNYNYSTYLQCINTVNSSSRTYFNYDLNPKLPTNGLKLWLDPYDRASLVLSNNKIVRWIDRSLNLSNATASETLGPTFDPTNSLLNFNGFQYLTLSTDTIPSGNTSYSIFMYVSTSNITQSGQWFLYSGTPTSNLSLGGFINSNLIVQSWQNNQVFSNSAISTNISYLVEFTYNSGIRRTFINGSLVGQDFVTTRNSTTSNNLIGTNSTLNSNLFGSVGDIIIYNRLLSNDERNSVKNYLERKKNNVSLHNIGNVVSWLDATNGDYLYDGNVFYKADYNDQVYQWLDRSFANNNATQSNTLVLPTRKYNLPTYQYALGGQLNLTNSNITINSQNENNISIFLRLTYNTNFQGTSLKIFNSSNVNITSTAVIRNSYVYYWAPDQLIGFSNVPLTGYNNPTESFRIDESDFYIPVQPNTNYRIDFTSQNPSGTTDLQFAYTPYYNDSLIFNQSYLTIPTASYPIDAYMVLKLSNINDSSDIIGVSPNSNNYSSLSYSNRRFNINATTNSLVSSRIETSDDYLLLEWSIANNNNYIRRFGSNIANTTVGTWSLPTNSNIIIGNANGFDFSRRFKGSIGEVIIFNKQLDIDYRYPVEGYLAWKWGLQSFLPSDHPYRNNAPYLFYKYVPPPGLSPISISGLVTWLDATDNTTFTLSGSNVTQWRDKSSNLNHFNNDNGNPTLSTDGGQSAVNFSGGPKLNGIKTISFTTTTRIFAISRTTHWDWQYLFNTPGLGNDRSIRYQGSTLRGMSDGSSSLPFDICGDTIFVNGKRNSDITDDLSTLHMWDGTIQSTFNSEIQLSSTFQNRFFRGFIGELLVYNSLSNNDYTKVQGYLAWKWNLQSKLPSNHPYKNSAP